jgi:hypothetical protein
MKKILLAMLVVLTFAASSFAGQSFLVAPSVGEGNWTVMGVYGTDHNGVVANADATSTTVMDANGLAVKGEYGMMKDLDLLVSYAFVTLPNIKGINDPTGDGKQTSGTKMGVGVKYSLGTQTLPLIGTVVDTAVAGGYEKADVGIKCTGISGTLGITDTTMSIAYVVSKSMDNNLMPYGAVAYKMLTTSYSKSTLDSLSGTALAFNIGCMIGIAKDQAIAVEYNTENDSFGGVSKSMTGKDDATCINVSGISLGYVYVF